MLGLQWLLLEVFKSKPLPEPWGVGKTRDRICVSNLLCYRIVGQINTESHCSILLQHLLLQSHSANASILQRNPPSGFMLGGVRSEGTGRCGARWQWWLQTLSRADTMADSADISLVWHGENNWVWGDNGAVQSMRNISIQPLETVIYLQQGSFELLFYPPNCQLCILCIYCLCLLNICYQTTIDKGSLYCNMQEQAHCAEN